MVNLFPISFRPLDQRILFTNEAGDFFISSNDFLERIVTKRITKEDQDFLLRKGFAYLEEDDFFYNSHLNRIYKLKQLDGRTHYIIVVPTLRCDLACSYCQVSRAALDASGYDWSDKIIQAFKDYLVQYSGDVIKIEFQGGEPSLRLDIIQDIVDCCDQHNIKSTFVICTNLNTISPSLEKLLKREDFFISTSIDGPNKTHTNNRTRDINITQSVNANYRLIRQRYGDNKINALPTIVGTTFEEIKTIIDYYVALGQKSIFLRPVNYQGFARKKFSGQRNDYQHWIEIYTKALEYIWSLNFYENVGLTEVGLEVALKRVFFPNYNTHVDLRSPNPAARDYIVVNYDGDIYPSDEARMLSRIGYVDLKIGNITTGLDTKKIADFNWNQMNEVHEDCIHCAFKPFCGIDTIDDMSRYGRIDLPKIDTYFCNTKLGTFDFIFSNLEKANPIAFYNISGHLTGNFSSRPMISDWIYD